MKSGRMCVKKLGCGGTALQRLFGMNARLSGFRVRRNGRLVPKIAPTERYC